MLKKAAIAALLLPLVVAVAALALFFFGAQPIDAKLTQCERDCLNDTGGRAWCATFCKNNASYGPKK